MTTKRKPTARAARRAPRFTPAPVRPRADGWTARRQVDFIGALAECACVDEACRRVGMTPSSAYALRRRADAASFRQAWSIALDYAVDRLSDAVFARAIHGVATPVFYKGEQIGERRRFDDRLATFVLRYRDPVRYGAWLDKVQLQRVPDGAAVTLHHAMRGVVRDGVAADCGLPQPPFAPIATTRMVTPDQAEAEEEQRLDAERRARDAAADAAQERAWAADASGADVA